ncbi:MAG: DUF72 domain-containing protein [Longimonas sp.]|uniref:DUF72 domain-containing protein n=1 Tax=Longimonas sp. TaxID=2039626 RepID=UPI0039751441
MSDVSSLDVLRDQADAYVFQHIHPHVRFGTASDRYAGWIGQVYPDEAADEVRTQSRSLGGTSYSIGKVPISYAPEYFDHFSVLEIDFTFYHPLHDAGDSTRTFHTLARYAEAAPNTARFLLKAPQRFSARTLRTNTSNGPRYTDNANYLDAEAYVSTFLNPARELLDNRLVGVIFQQEYQRRADSPPPRAFADDLDSFFAEVPTEVPTHLEIRSAHLLQPVYFDWLASRGLGHVFSHWNWLPMIREQWHRAGKRFTERTGTVVCRLLTPRDMPYAEAFKHAHPFDAAVPALSETQQAHDMVLDATALAFQAEQQDTTLHLIANNRAWGNAPELARTIAHRILDERKKRSKKYS